MTISFTPDALVTQPISALPAGSFFWLPRLRTGPLDLNLLVGDPTQYYSAVDLTGNEAFVLRRGRREAVANELAIVLPTPNLAIEVAEPVRTSGQMEMRGALVVGETGPHLAVLGTVDGFSEHHYISLRDWSINDHVPNTRLVLQDWRLVTWDEDRRTAVALLSPPSASEPDMINS